MVGGASRRKRIRKQHRRLRRAALVTGAHQGWGESPGVNFDFEGREEKPWWESENWVMVSDPANAYGDLRIEEKLKLEELLKGRKGIKR